MDAKIDRPEVINECPDVVPDNEGKTQDYITIANITRLCCLCNKETFLKDLCK